MAFDFSRWSLARWFRSRSTAVEPSAERATNPYHAVSIACGTPACAAVRSLGDKRFLSSEAPRLPLESCDFAECRCRYRHHDDRRRGLRRSSDDSGVTSPWSGPERRRGRGRRASDFEAAPL